MTLLVMALAQAVATPTAGQLGPVLWREFRQGMTPDQFADILKNVDGIKSVEVIRKGKKPARLKITYVNGAGVVIGALTLAVSPAFANERLVGIDLSHITCYSIAAVEVTTTMQALATKYSGNQKVSVVDEHGAVIDTQRAFFNDETRVTLSASPIENPYPQHLYGGTGFVAAMNKLANSMADGAYNSAIAECPNDAGRKARVMLSYSSQADFARANANEQAERAAKARATQDGL